MSQRDFILLDRSGSMASRWHEALSSINDYVKTLKDEEVETALTVATFNSSIGQLNFDIVRNCSALADYRDLTEDEIAPVGGTPLNDAIGALVELAKSGDYEKAALIIMTDGEELDSRKLNRAQAKALLDECRAKGWQVLFLGADYDARSQASAYGTIAAQTQSVQARGLGNLMRETGMMRAGYAATGAAMTYGNDAWKDRLNEETKA